MTFLLRIKNQDSVIGMQILSLFIMHHLNFYFMLHSEKNVCSTNMQKKTGGKEKSPYWHFFIFTYFEWSFGREPLVLSLNF